jgi:hypothetical protein
MFERDKYDLEVLNRMGAVSRGQGLRKYGMVSNTLTAATKLEGCIRRKARVS